MRDGMRIEWDVPIAMDDGLVLRADVFRPMKRERYPVILTYGPYAKGSRSRTAIRAPGSAWSNSIPDVAAGSTKQLSELGSRRSGKMGAARLRLCACRFARLRLFARLH